MKHPLYITYKLTLILNGIKTNNNFCTPLIITFGTTTTFITIPII